MRITYLAYWIGMSVMICAMGMKTVEFIYFSPGEDITLKCKCKVFYWHGPSLENEKDTSPVDETDIYGVIKIWNVSIYTKNYTLANTLPRNLSRRLKVIGVNLDLHITNSLSDEGLYFCEVIKNCFVIPKRYILQQKLLPTKLDILQVIDNYTVKGIENPPLELTCLVESGKPPEKLRWKKEGIIVSKGGPSKLVYSFVPDRNDNLNRYTCEVHNRDMNTPLNKTIHLDIAYKPDIKVNSSGNCIAEGDTPHLCCNSTSNPKPTSISWYTEDKELLLTNSESSLCYKMSNVSRHDSGNYTCSSQNEFGNASKDISLVILYPPVVYMLHSIFTEDNNILREIQCIAQGEPDSYNFLPWEHRSEFDEHIRYLDGTNEGILQLPQVNALDKYQDSGIYICNVSNGIPDYRGNVFQLGRVHFASKGLPIFINKTQIVQYSIEGHQYDLTVYVYSVSNITCSAASNLYGYAFPYTIIMEPIITSTEFYGQTITIHALKVVFTLQTLRRLDFQMYTVTLCNRYGNSSIHVELRRQEKPLSSEGISITIIVCMIVIVAGMSIYIGYLKLVYRKRLTTSITIQTPERNGSESAQYDEIIEDDNNTRNQMQGNNYQIVSLADIIHVAMENRDITNVSGYHSSTISVNDGNGSEILNDGYEKPYATLMAIDRDENKDVYLSTRNRSTNEHSTALDLAACGNSYEFTELHSVPDGTKSDDVEYINLSLK